MTHASVFSGIGGPEVAAAMLGWENLFHCEINPFGRAVLDYWFPNSKSYEDITTTDFSEWSGRVNVLTGGFPCQPFSYAGRRRGAQDDRYLWPYMHRCINQVRPDWVVCENVAGIITMVEQGDVTEMATEKSLFDEGDTLYRYRLEETFTLERICDDLESDGYAVQAVVIPACAVNAPHRRDRVFIIGHRNDATDTEHNRLQHNIERGSKNEVLRKASSRGEDSIPKQVEPIKADGGGWFVADTDGFGQSTHVRQSGRTREKMDIRGEGKPFNGVERFGSPRFVADPTLMHLNRSKSGYGCDGSRQPQPEFRSCDCTEDEGSPSAYTESQQGGRLRPEQPECVKTQQGELGGGNQQDGRGGYAPHTRCTGLEECKQLTSNMGKEDSGRPTRGYCDGCVQSRECNYWAGFPTVSPVHRGNDGLPFSLDDLTISASKWRTESLKAYGNAIVPQVMYEIFRAIEQVYHNLN